MTIGEKIRDLRTSRSLTQREVAGEKITRNMLCEIERGTAVPSLQTLYCLAEKLGVSPGYLIDDTRTPESERREAWLPALHEAYKTGKYEECVRMAEENELDVTDPEIAYLLCCAHLCAAESCVIGGTVKRALEHLEKMKSVQPFCIFDTAHLFARAELCHAMVSDPLTPKYALRPEVYSELAHDATREELYHYLSDDWDYPYNTPLYRIHTEAKKLMKEYRYADATARLTEIVNNRFSEPVSVLLLYRIYSDLDTCFRERKDYENAYKYASKKCALLSQFRS